MLVGYQRILAASVINTLLAVADTVAFYVILHVLDGDLVCVGARLARCHSRQTPSCSSLLIGCLDPSRAGAAVAGTCTAAALLTLSIIIAFPPHASVRLAPRCRSDTIAHSDPAPFLDGASLSAGESLPDQRAQQAASLLTLARDSLNVLIRSVFLSGSILAMMLAVAPLGPAAVGAHAVVMQLWMVTSYVVDGFADVCAAYTTHLIARA